MAYVDDVAPAIAMPFFIHWYVKGPVPAAEAVKLAAWPATTPRAAGAAATVTCAQVDTVAVALVSVPVEFVITTS